MSTNREQAEQAVLQIFQQNAVTAGNFLRLGQLRAQWPLPKMDARELIRGIHALESTGYLEFLDVASGPFLRLTISGHERIHGRDSPTITLHP